MKSGPRHKNDKAAHHRALGESAKRLVDESPTRGFVLLSGVASIGDDGHVVVIGEGRTSHQIPDGDDWHVKPFA